MKYIVQVGAANVLYSGRDLAGKALDILAQGIIVRDLSWRGDQYAACDPTSGDGVIGMKTISDAAYQGAEDAGMKQAFEAVAEMRLKLEEKTQEGYRVGRELNEARKEIEALKLALAPPPPAPADSEETVQ